MSKRVSIGKQQDGSYGIRVSLPGYDAYADSTNLMSFDSAWTDIARIHALGVVSWASSAWLDPLGNAISGFRGSWADPGYIPFAEIRRLVSGVSVRDDYWNATLPSGSYASVYNTEFRIGEASTSDQALFITYKIACPSG